MENVDLDMEKANIIINQLLQELDMWSDPYVRVREDGTEESLSADYRRRLWDCGFNV